MGGLHRKVDDLLLAEMHEHIAICELEGHVGRAVFTLAGIHERQFCSPHELYIRQARELHEALALLALPLEPDELDPVIPLKVGSLRREKLLAAPTAHEPGSRRKDRQASRHGNRCRRGLSRLQRARGCCGKRA